MRDGYTRHGEMREQQRSISPAVIEWLDDFGHYERRRKGDVYFFDKDGRKRLKKYLGGIAYRRIEDLLDVYVVTADDGQIITVGKRTTKLKRA